MLSDVDGSLVLLSWEDMNPALVQEIQHESASCTLDVLTDGLRPQDAVETTPGADKYVVSDAVPPTPAAMYLILM